MGAQLGEGAGQGRTAALGFGRGDDLASVLGHKLAFADR
jgi:hypothetical protein